MGNLAVADKLYEVTPPTLCAIDLKIHCQYMYLTNCKLVFRIHKTIYIYIYFLRFFLLCQPHYKEQKYYNIGLEILKINLHFFNNYFVVF